MLAKLSGVLGGKLPGDDGVSARWSIDYRSPLYVDEPAVLRLDRWPTSRRPSAWSKAASPSMPASG